MKFVKILLALVLVTQCSTLKQGIEGNLIWVEGNQMPGPDRKPSALQGVTREIYIYPLLSLDDVTLEGVFVSEVNKPLFKKIMSDQNGKFTVDLPAGEYSILIKENDGLFVNLFDEKNHLNPITVSSNQVTWVDITINYKAVY